MMVKIELHRLYASKELPYPVEGLHFVQRTLPTQVEIGGPEWEQHKEKRLVPVCRRVYYTDLYHFQRDDVIMTWQEYRETYLRVVEDEGIEGCLPSRTLVRKDTGEIYENGNHEDSKSIAVMEVMGTGGDDGWVSYHLAGYVFLHSAELGKNEEASGQVALTKHWEERANQEKAHYMEAR